MKLLTGISANELPPRFRDDNFQCVQVRENSSATLAAELYELSKDTVIEWTKDDGNAPLVPETRRRLRITGNLVQLTLDNVQKDDAGIYRVEAKSPRGKATRDLELRIENEDEPPAFLRRLNDLSVKIGTRTRFLVEIKSDTDLNIEWFHNEEPVQEDERLRIVSEGGFYCLDVAPVTAQDNGRWTCTARNSSGRASSTSHLNVLVPKTYKPPEFHEELRALLTEQGTVSLECKVVGVPAPFLRWFKDGREIRAGDVFALTADPDDPKSLGTYLCEATNCMGKAVSISKLHVIGKTAQKPLESLPFGPPPIFKAHLKDEAIKIGDSLLLSCQVSVPPWPKCITWYNSEGKIEEIPGGRYHQMADGLGCFTLEVKPTEACDQGEWKCVATSEDDSISISLCTVKMNIPKYYKKPRFMDSLKAILTDEGLVSFECKVVGSPTPLLRWFKDGQELKPGDVYLLTGTNSLGSYCCIAKNCMGEAKSSAELTIEDIQSHLNDDERAQLISKSRAPKILHGLKSVEVKINEPHRFTVQVSVTTPLDEISWYRDDMTISNEPERYIPIKENLGVYHLDVKRVEHTDQVEWKCVATNEFGHSVTTCFVKVLIPKHYKKPKFLENLRAVLSEEGAVNLECKVIGVPQPVLTWYKDGVELKPGDIHRITSGEGGTCCLGTYTCEARNCMGTVSSSASLLGFEEQQKTRAAQRMELARVPSLSTIHEEHTSQLYGTPQADSQSMAIDTGGEVSFSFDGKDVSVSLYETPDLTEDEAIQIVEMYADQLSEHISEHNMLELPSLRFVKETSNSGNLIMEAVVVDVADDYFTSSPEADPDDLRTEADIDELTDGVVEYSMLPKRPPRKSDSKSSNSFYSFSRNRSSSEEAGADESLAAALEIDSESIGEYASAQIAETSSLDRRPLTPRTAHEIGSDLRVNRSESSEIQQKRDLQGEEGDGLITDKKSELKSTLSDIKLRLKNVEHEIFIASFEKFSPTASDKSIELLNGILTPINDIETILETGQTTIESMAPPIFELQKALILIEKCMEIQGRDHTIIQKTCVNILDTITPQIYNVLTLVEHVSLVGKPDTKITDEFGTTLGEIVGSLEKSEGLLREKQTVSLEQASTSSDDEIKQLYVTAMELKHTLEDLEQFVVNNEHVELRQPILENLSQPFTKLENQLETIRKQALKHANSKSLIQELRLLLLHKLTPAYDELSQSYQYVLEQNSGDDDVSLLQSFMNPSVEILTTLDKLRTSLNKTSKGNDSTKRLEELSRNIQDAREFYIAHPPILESLHHLSNLVEILTQNEELLEQQQQQQHLENINQLLVSNPDNLIGELSTALNVLEESSSPSLKQHVRRVGSKISQILQENVVVILENVGNILVPNELINDTRSLLQLVETCNLEKLTPSLEALDEILMDQDLVANCAELPLQTRFHLQKYVQPLEYIEDEIIETLDTLFEQQANVENSEISTILQRLQYNVAVIHQRIVDETHFVRQTPKASFDELKKCIQNTIENLPVISEVSDEDTETTESLIVSAETSRAILESVFELEKCLACFREGEQHATSSLLEELSSHVQDLKLSNVVTHEDLKKLSKLRRFSETISTFGDQRSEVFNFLLEHLHDIMNLVQNLGEEWRERLERLVEPLGESIEIIELEKSNLEISELDQLEKHGQLVANIRDNIVEFIRGSTCRNLHELLEILNEYTAETDDNLKFIKITLRNFGTALKEVLNKDDSSETGKSEGGEEQLGECAEDEIILMKKDQVDLLEENETVSSTEEIIKNEGKCMREGTMGSVEEGGQNRGDRSKMLEKEREMLNVGEEMMQTEKVADQALREDDGVFEEGDVLQKIKDTKNAFEKEQIMLMEGREVSITREWATSDEIRERGKDEEYCKIEGTLEQGGDTQQKEEEDMSNVLEEEHNTSKGTEKVSINEEGETEDARKVSTEEEKMLNREEKGERMKNGDENSTKDEGECKKEETLERGDSALQETTVLKEERDMTKGEEIVSNTEVGALEDADKVSKEEGETKSLEENVKNEEHQIRIEKEILQEIIRISNEISETSEEMSTEISKLVKFISETNTPHHWSSSKNEEIFIENAKNFMENLNSNPSESTRLTTLFEKLQETVISSHENAMNLYEHLESIYETYQNIERMENLLKILNNARNTLKNNDLDALSEIITNLEENLHALPLKNEQKIVEYSLKTLAELTSYMRDASRTSESVKLAIETLKLSLVSLEENRFKSTMETFEETLKNIVNSLENIPSQEYTKIRKTVMDNCTELQLAINSYDSSKLNRKRRCILTEVLRALTEINGIVKGVQFGGYSECETLDNLNDFLEKSRKVVENSGEIPNLPDVSNMRTLQNHTLKLNEGLKCFIDSLEETEDKTEEHLHNLQTNLANLRNVLQTRDDEIPRELHSSLSTLQFVISSFIDDEKKTIKSTELGIVCSVTDHLEQLSRILNVEEITPENMQIIREMSESLRKASESINRESPVKDFIEPLHEISFQLAKINEKFRKSYEIKTRALRKLAEELRKFAARSENLNATVEAFVEKPGKISTSSIELVQNLVEQCNLEFSHGNLIKLAANLDVISENNEKLQEFRKALGKETQLASLIKISNSLEVFMRQTPQGEDMDILTALKHPMGVLKENLSKGGRLNDDDVKLITSLTEAVENLNGTFKNSSNFEDFSEGLYILENVLISACLKAVLDDTECTKSLIQNILPALDSLAKGVINVQNEFSSRKQLRKHLIKLCERTEKIAEHSQNETLSKITANVQIKARQFQHEDVDSLSKYFEEIPKMNLPKHLNEHLKRLEKICEKTVPETTIHGKITEISELLEEIYDSLQNHTEKAGEIISATESDQVKSDEGEKIEISTSNNEAERETPVETILKESESIVEVMKEASKSEESPYETSVQFGFVEESNQNDVNPEEKRVEIEVDGTLSDGKVEVLGKAVAITKETGGASMVSDTLQGATGEIQRGQSGIIAAELQETKVDENPERAVIMGGEIPPEERVGIWEKTVESNVEVSIESENCQEDPREIPREQSENIPAEIVDESTLIDVNSEGERVGIVENVTLPDEKIENLEKTVAKSKETKGDSMKDIEKTHSEVIPVCRETLKKEETEESLVDRISMRLEKSRALLIELTDSKEVLIEEIPKPEVMQGKLASKEPAKKEQLTPPTTQYSLISGKLEPEAHQAETSFVRTATKLSGNLKEIEDSILKLTPDEGLVKLSASLHQLQQGIQTIENQEGSIKLKSETLEKLEEINAPLEKLSSVLVQLQSDPHKDVALASPEVKTALVALKETVGHVETEISKMSFNESVIETLESLRADISNITTEESKPDEIVVGISQVQDELKKLNLYKVDGNVVQKGILSCCELCQPLEELKNGIQSFQEDLDENVDIVNIKERTLEKLKTIDAPLEKLTIILVQLEMGLKRAEVSEETISSMRKALISLKETMEVVEKSVPKTGATKVVLLPIEYLQASISNIEEILKPEKKIAEKMLLEIVKVQDNLKQLTLVQVQENLQQGIVSLTQLLNPLDQLKQGIQSFEENRALDVSDIKETTFEKLKTIDVPLEKLTPILVQLKAGLRKADVSGETISSMKTALISLKETMEVIENSVPRTSATEIVLLPLETLRASISNIGETLEPKKRIAEKMLMEIATVQDNLEKLICSNVRGDPQQGLAQVINPLNLLKQEIQTLDTRNQDENAIKTLENLDQIRAPLQKLSLTITQHFQDPKKAEISHIIHPEVKTALLALRMSAKIVENTTEFSKSTQLLLEPLQALQAGICNVSSQIKILKNISKVKQITSSNQLHYLNQLTNPLEELEQCIENLEENQCEDVAKMKEATLDKLQEIDTPLEKLYRVLTKPPYNQAEKDVQDGISSLETSIQRVKIEIPKTAFAEFLITPLEALQRHLRNIQISKKKDDTNLPETTSEFLKDTDALQAEENSVQEGSQQEFEKPIDRIEATGKLESLEEKNGIASKEVLSRVQIESQVPEKVQTQQESCLKLQAKLKETPREKLDAKFVQNLSRNFIVLSSNIANLKKIPEENQCDDIKLLFQLASYTKNIEELLTVSAQVSQNVEDISNETFKELKIFNEAFNCFNLHLTNISTNANIPVIYQNLLKQHYDITKGFKSKYDSIIKMFPENETLEIVLNSLGTLKNIIVSIVDQAKLSKIQRRNDMKLLNSFEETLKITQKIAQKVKKLEKLDQPQAILIETIRDARADSTAAYNSDFLCQEDIPREEFVEKREGLEAILKLSEKLEENHSREDLTKLRLHFKLMKSNGKLFESLDLPIDLMLKAIDNLLWFEKRELEELEESEVLNDQVQEECKNVVENIEIQRRNDEDEKIVIEESPKVIQEMNGQNEREIQTIIEPGEDVEGVDKKIAEEPKENEVRSEDDKQEDIEEKNSPVVMTEKNQEAPKTVQDQIVESEINKEKPTGTKQKDEVELPELLVEEEVNLEEYNVRIEETAECAQRNELLDVNESEMAEEQKIITEKEKFSDSESLVVVEISSGLKKGLLENGEVPGKIEEPVEVREKIKDQVEVSIDLSEKVQPDQKESKKSKQEADQKKKIQIDGVSKKKTAKTKQKHKEKTEESAQGFAQFSEQDKNEESKTETHEKATVEIEDVPATNSVKTSSTEIQIDEQHVEKQEHLSEVTPKQKPVETKQEQAQKPEESTEPTPEFQKEGLQQNEEVTLEKSKGDSKEIAPEEITSETKEVGAMNETEAPDSIETFQKIETEEAEKKSEHPSEIIPEEKEAVEQKEKPEESKKVPKEVSKLEETNGNNSKTIVSDNSTDEREGVTATIEYSSMITTDSTEILQDNKTEDFQKLPEVTPKRKQVKSKLEQKTSVKSEEVEEPKPKSPNKELKHGRREEELIKGTIETPLGETTEKMEETVSKLNNEMKTKDSTPEPPAQDKEEKVKLQEKDSKIIETGEMKPAKMPVKDSSAEIRGIKKTEGLSEKIDEEQADRKKTEKTELNEPVKSEEISKAKDAQIEQKELKKTLLETENPSRRREEKKTQFKFREETQQTSVVPEKTQVESKHEVNMKKSKEDSKLPHKTTESKQFEEEYKIKRTTGNTFTGRDNFEIPPTGPKPYFGERSTNKPPTFSTCLFDKTSQTSSTATLTCTLLTTENTTLQWYKNNTPLKNTQNISTTFDRTTKIAKLVVSNCVPDDSGEYKCIAENPNGKSATRAYLSVISSSKEPKKTTFTEHLEPDMLRLECKIKCTSPHHVKWYKDNQEISLNKRYILNYLETGIARLIVPKPTEQDNGIYTCEVLNDDEGHIEKLAHCVRTFSPNCEVKWYKEGRSIDETNNNNNFEKSEKYTCKIMNEFGKIEKCTTVEVANPEPSHPPDGKPPMFISRPEKILSVRLGDDVSVSFRMNGDPKPKLILMKGLSDITETSRCYKETSDDYHRFTLTSLCEKDMGTYCVLAKNLHGCDRAFFTLTLRPRARSATPTRDYNNSSNSIISNYPERNYFQEVPGPITEAPTLVDSGRNWISLSWSKPEPRTAPVIAYKIEAWLHGADGEARWMDLGLSPINSYDAFNLKPGGSYQFRVTPRNRYGWGEPVRSEIISLGNPADLPEFIELLPPQMKELLGSKVTLECTLASAVSDIKWYKNSCEIDDGRFESSTIDGTKCLLNIKSLHHSDAGRYICEATNKTGRVSTFARLCVVDDENVIKADKNLKLFLSEYSDRAAPPQFTMRLRDRKVQITHPVRLTCQIIATPNPNIKWYKDGCEITENEHYAFSNEEHFFTLEIAKTNSKDAGTYTITASNVHGTVSSNCILILDRGLTSHMSPPIFKTPLQVTPKKVYENDELHISGKVEAYPNVRVVWYKDGVRLRASRKSCMNVSKNGSLDLRVANVALKDSGVYTCVSNNEVGSVEASVTVEVEGREMRNSSENSRSECEVIQEPKFLKKPRSFEAHEGDNVVILCEIIGEPEPEVIWFRDFLKPEYYRDAPHFHRIDEGNEYRLEIPNAKIDFTGTYAVYAKNVHGDAKAIISLQIKARDARLMCDSNDKISKLRTFPVIRRELKDMRCCDGDSVTFECEIERNTSVEIQWKKGGKLIRLNETGDFQATFEDSSIARLNIKQVYPEDEGEYTCVAFNELGNVTTSACLVVDIPDNVLCQELNVEPDTGNNNSFSSSSSIYCYREEIKRIRSPSSKRNYCSNKKIKATPPKFYTIPHNRVAEEGETVKFQCAVSGYPDPYTSWEKNGCVLISPSNKITITELDDLRVLEIQNVTKDDSGTYKITLENEVGKIEASATLDVVLHRNYRTVGAKTRARSLSPRVSSYTRGVPLSLSFFNSRLHTDIRSVPTPFLKWYSDDVPKEFGVLKHPTSVLCRVGETASFCVRTFGNNGKFRVTWKVGNAFVEDYPNKFKMVEEGNDVSILHIDDVQLNDAGTVLLVLRQLHSSSRSDECHSPHGKNDDDENVVAEVTMTSLVVSDQQMDLNGNKMSAGVEKEETAAVLVRGPQDTTALVGDRVLLKATYMGHPEPKVKWCKAGRILKNDGRTSITFGDGVSCLLLQEITTDDSGKYDVCIENPHGSDCCYASVSVEGPPDPPSGKPSITVSSDSVTVAWSSSPYDGGRIVTGFALDYCLLGSEVWTTITDNCHSLSYTLKGQFLPRPGARYVFRVRSQNVHGYSKPGLESDVLHMDEVSEISTFEPRMVFLEPGPEFKARYEILEELGKGRFGVVHKVVDKTTSQKLAAKFIRCRTSKDRDKVQEEIDIMNQLRHQKLLQLAAAFENLREMIMVMEYISGGELFERVVADDFTLTEKDCILFMQQICEGVAYMHNQRIVHLDLKPENIMCHTRTSHEIKIIDFGLAQKLDPEKPTRVLFGTPEFIPPEIINYEVIGMKSDMWSIGVICYVLLSGLSPFMGENDAETFANIIRADYDFEDEAFNTVSQNARDFIAALLIKRKDERLSAEECLKHTWLDLENHHNPDVVLSTDKLKKFIIRRKWQGQRAQRRAAA